MEKLREGLVCGWLLFVSVNRLFEGSLDGVNDSMKTKPIPWLSEGLQKSSHVGGLSTGCVLASEQRQESTRMLLKPSEFKSVGDSAGELSQGWYLNCLGMLQFPAFWLKQAYIESNYVSSTRKRHFLLTHTFTFF